MPAHISPPVPTPYQIALQISRDVAIDARTVRRAYQGQRVVPGLHAMITASAERLGLPLPPDNPAPLARLGAARQGER